MALTSTPGGWVGNRRVCVPPEGYNLTGSGRGRGRGEGERGGEWGQLAKAAETIPRHLSVRYVTHLRHYNPSA